MSVSDQEIERIHIHRRNGKSIIRDIKSNPETMVVIAQIPIPDIRLITMISDQFIRAIAIYVNHLELCRSCPSGMEAIVHMLLFGMAEMSAKEKQQRKE